MTRIKKSLKEKTEKPVPDLSRDKEALLMMKKIEKKLNPNLVSYQFSDGTIITTTKERMKQLIEDHLNPKICR